MGDLNSASCSCLGSSVGMVRAQLVRALPRMQKVVGSNPTQGLKSCHIMKENTLSQLNTYMQAQHFRCSGRKVHSTYSYIQEVRYEHYYIHSLT